MRNQCICGSQLCPNIHIEDIQMYIKLINADKKLISVKYLMWL